MRNSGFYWVRPKTAHEPYWEVAEWHTGAENERFLHKTGWSITGHWETKQDSDFDEIDERQIVRGTILHNQKEIFCIPVVNGEIKGDDLVKAMEAEKEGRTVTHQVLDG